MAFALDDGAAGGRLALAMGTVSLLQAAARDEPVLVVVDDAQWLDNASSDALQFVMRRVHGCRVGMLVAARSGEFGLAGVETLELQGLSERAGVELVHARAAVEPSVARSLVAATAGNPLALSSSPPPSPPIS